ncbi:hypothetical protein D9M70_311580 [compost metagenome]
MVPACASISSTPRMRSSDSTSSPPAGVAAPASPVRPPCGTTGCRRRLQIASTADTSAVLRGRATATGGRGSSGAYQSLRKRVSMASPTCRPAGSSAPASSASRAEGSCTVAIGSLSGCVDERGECVGAATNARARPRTVIRANRRRHGGTTPRTTASPTYAPLQASLLMRALNSRGGWRVRARCSRAGSMTSASLWKAGLMSFSGTQA